MLSCILLAAGLSSRFGSPKALAELRGKTVLHHIQENLLASRVDEILVVLGAAAEEIKPHLLNHKKIKSVYNKDYLLGQTSSFQRGLQSLSLDTTGIILVPVDYPFILPETVDLLAEYFITEHPAIIVPVYGPVKGHPPVFNAGLRKTLLRMSPDCGLNVFIHERDASVVLFPVEDPGIVESFNTPEEFAALKRAHQ